MSKQILIIEDNRELSQLLKLHLRDLGLVVDCAADGLAGLSKAESGSFDLILLDIMLPGIDGIEVCRRLRARSNYTPILMLTSKSSELDRVVGLEIGADDYVTKPFSIPELIARVKAIMRRVEKLANITQEEPDNSIDIENVHIDMVRRSVLVDERSIELTPREFDLLVYFARHPGRVFTREQLLNQVWGFGHEGYEHTVNSHINRLRAKIEKDPARPKYILTVWGVGYKFAEQAL